MNWCKGNLLGMPWFGYHAIVEPSYEYEIGEKMIVSSTNQASSDQKLEKLI